MDKKIPYVPSRPLLAGARNKCFTAFHILYSNFPHAAASVTIVTFFFCSEFGGFFLLAFLSYLKILFSF